MTDRTDASELAWDQRQQSMGCTPQAVLFKRFPGWLNGWLHRRHVRFILRNLPARAERILDVGCGYGRIALAVKQARPNTALEGVEFCEAFADNFEKQIGRCYRVPIQEFRPENRYDAILVVTLLMYLSEDDRSRVLSTLWESLRPGGRLICIEPAVEIVRLANRVFRRRKLAGSTSGVRQFSMVELATILQTLPASSVVGSAGIRLLPGIASLTLHHCIAVEKEK